MAHTAKIIGDIPDFNVLNVPKMQPRHNPAEGNLTCNAQDIYPWYEFENE